MLKQTKGFILGFITCALLFTLAVTVFAAPIYKTVEIVYNSIKINIDGKEITPKDANGNIVEPFNYNGTIYLPVRGVGDALGKDVSWDGDTQTVFMKDKAQEAISQTPSFDKKVFEGRIEKSDSVNTYNFTLPYASRITIDFEHIYVESGGDNKWKIRLLKKEYNEKIIEINSAGKVVKTSTIPLYLPAGDYYIEVAPWGTDSYYRSDADYKVTFNYEKNIGQYETEDNNTVETANQISLGKSITGNIFKSDDTDYFKFIIDKKTDAYIEFNHNYVDSGGDNKWTVQLYEKSTAKRLDFNIPGKHVTTNSPKVTLEPGEYYIKVSPWGTDGYYRSDVDYILTVKTQ